jgi:hypothetical protein
MSLYDKSSLVLIPSGTKTGKVYSQKPVSGDGDFTFTRASAATRVNADGNIEKETQNLLRYSNVFNNASWVKTNTTLTSGQTGYDGSSNAWLLSKSAANGHIRQNITPPGLFTASVYLKAGTLSWAYLYLDPTTGTDPAAYINLNDGSVGTTSASVIDVVTESVVGGWYRCSITASLPTASAFFVFPADANNNISGTSGNILIQDAQLEQGLVARDFITTTTAALYGGITDNTPRLDYTDSSCPSLKLEPQRTNIFVQSEYFTGGDWDLNAGTTLTDNYATSPEGVQNSTRYVGTGASGLGDKYTLVNGTQYTISAYVKSNTGTTQNCRLIGDSSNVSSDLEVTTEWTRIQYTWTSGGLTNKTNGIFRDSSNNDIDILIFALQLEAGSYPTSYIPTYGSSVSRVADASEITSASSIIGQSEGTIFIELGDMDTNADNDVWIELSDGTTNNRILIYNDGSGSIRNQIKASGTISSLINTGVTLASNQKIAITYASNEAKVFINGVQYGSTDTSVVVPATSQINLSNFTNVITQSRTLKQALLFNTKLTDAECITLTTI